MRKATPQEPVIFQSSDICQARLALGDRVLAEMRGWLTLSAGEVEKLLPA